LCAALRGGGGGTCDQVALLRRAPPAQRLEALTRLFPAELPAPVVAGDAFPLACETLLVAASCGGDGARLWRGLLAAAAAAPGEAAEGACIRLILRPADAATPPISLLGGTTALFERCIAACREALSFESILAAYRRIYRPDLGDPAPSARSPSEASR
jgi:hypothetical protein